MRILVTNDDGIMAPGIEALYRAVADLGHVDVVAPESPQSAVGHAISIRTPLLAHRVQVRQAFEGWAVQGSPADCVKLAMKELLEAPPDFVLSGINHGANTGINVLYSGTVAGASEGAFFGTPAIAFSQELSDVLDFEKARVVARGIFQRFASSRPPRGMCLSVNIPACDKGWPLGVRCVPMAMAPMEDAYRKQFDELGRVHYWLDGEWPDHRDHPESDLEAIHERYVSITPLRFQLTDERQLSEIRGWGWPQDFAATESGK